MGKRIISLDQTTKITKLSKNTILRYLRAGDFPAAIPNPRNFYLFWDNEVADWNQSQKQKVMQKWHHDQYQKKIRTENYIAEIERNIIIKQLVNTHLASA